jgi:hypothetical protein
VHGLILPFCNAEAMNPHLVEIAADGVLGAHLFLADQADWHMSMWLAVPTNITIIALPKSPNSSGSIRW